MLYLFSNAAPLKLLGNQLNTHDYSAYVLFLIQVEILLIYSHLYSKIS